MKLMVFGGTGQSGAAVLQLSTEDPDLEVTAFVRNPDKIPADIRNKLTVVTGDVLTFELVEKALVGQEAVISCLGTGDNFGETTVISEGVENIINGMRKHHVEKLAVVGVSFLLPGRAVQPFLKKITDDHERALNILRRAKDIRWTIAMAPQITKAPCGSQYKTSINKLPGDRVVATLDLADWMINCAKYDANMDKYAHQLVGISSDISQSTD